MNNVFHVHRRKKYACLWTHVAFVVGKALLVQSEVVQGAGGVHELDGVLHADLHVVLVYLGEPETNVLCIMRYILKSVKTSASSSFTLLMPLF